MVNYRLSIVCKKLVKLIKNLKDDHAFETSALILRVPANVTVHFFLENTAFEFLLQLKFLSLCISVCPAGWN
jgi:hypothetical protein